MHKSVWLLLALTLGLSGCVYKRDIYQGNILAKENVQQLRKGMTHEEVIDTLGNPVMQSIFEPSTKQTYIEYHKPGQGKAKGSTVTLTFKDDKLIDIQERVL